MVRLQANRKAARQADRVAEARDDAALGRDGDQVLVAHELADGGDHLRRQPGAQPWGVPASACLSSRIPYGTPVTIEKVKTVETGEEEIKALGFRQFRVRFHGEVVRLEIAREEMERALTLEMAQRFTAIFKALGFKYVTLDLEGYRQGSLNEVLNLK